MVDTSHRAGLVRTLWTPSRHLRGKWSCLRGAICGRDCTPCPSRPLCTRPRLEPRIVGLQSREHHEALQTMRTQQTTEEFRKAYALRAGVESTHAQAIRRSGLRHARYPGLAKTHLQHVITAAAINMVRIASWANGRPIAKTRCSYFAALQLQAA